MKSNSYLLSIIIFSTILACQTPGNTEQVLLDELYENLVEQRKYTYEVSYSEGYLNEKPLFNLYGTGKLTRNGASSLSRFYFGPAVNKKEHAFFMIHNQGHYTEQIKSILFEESHADILADSLQSAILINPDILLRLKGENKVEVCKINGGFQFEFYNQLEKRHILIETDQENQTLSKISIHQKSYNNRDYIRTWSFNHLNKEEYKEQLAICEKQFESVNRMFL